MRFSWLAGAYTNLVKLQMQQQSTEVQQRAEVEEVVAADGKPVSKANVEHVVSRQATPQTEKPG